MKILHIVAWFIPGTGYHENLISRYQALDGHDVTIFTTELEHMPNIYNVYLPKDLNTSDMDFQENSNVKLRRFPVNGTISARPIWDKKIIASIIEENPDVLFIHGNDSTFGLWYTLFYLKKLNYTVVMDSHMVLIASVNPLAKLFRFFYRHLIAPVINRNDIYVIRLSEEDYVIKHLGVRSELAPLLSFGSDTQLYCPDKNRRRQMRSEMGISDTDVVFVYAGKLSEDKHGIFLADSIQKKIEVNGKRPVFIIVGNTSGNYGDLVKEKLAQSENRILRFPIQTYNALPAFFQVADVGVIPYATSLIVYDMQACGLPVLLTNHPINESRVGERKQLLFNTDDKDDLRAKIKDVMMLNEKELEKMKIAARLYVEKGYSYKDVTKKFTDIMEQSYKAHFEIGKYR